jgi:hypothetical protein
MRYVIDIISRFYKYDSLSFPAGRFVEVLAQRREGNA